MKTIATLLSILFFSFANAQEVIIRVTGLAGDTAVELDTIQIDNLSNGTKLALHGFPGGVTDYEINLSQGTYNSVQEFDKRKEHIVLIGNTLYQTRIRVTLQNRQTIHVQVFDLSGRILANSNIEGTYGENLIEVCTNQFSVIQVSTNQMTRGFKAAGIFPDRQVSIKNKKNLSVKNGVLIADKKALNGFVYNPGDSLKITAVNNNLHSNFLVKIPQNLDHYQIYLSSPCPGAETVTDFDGNIYNTVVIGNQCWMKENLKTIHYADGTPLIDGTGIPTIDITTKYWFNYGDDPANAEVYGKLYPWAAVMNGESSSYSVPSGVQGVCPDGWHVPSKAEWDILVNYLGGSNVAGGKLKESGYQHWDYPNSGANNQSGFSALPGGRSFITEYYGINLSSYFAVCTLNDDAYMFILSHNHPISSCMTDSGTQQNGHSVRCIKD